MKVFVLLVQWKDDEPEVSGIFSSFDKAVMYFVRTNYQDSGLKGPELLSVCTRAALKMAHKTDDEDFSEFGSTRAWVEEETVDDRCEDWEKGGEDDGD